MRKFFNSILMQKMIILIILDIILCENLDTCNKSLKIEERKTKIKSVQIFFRHGRRTPILEKFTIKNIIWNSWEVDENLPHTMFNYTIMNINGSRGRPSPNMDDFYNNMGPLPGGAFRGKLTVLGQLDAFRLGKLFKNFYVDSSALSIKKFDNKKIRLYSTNYDRTIQSLRCVLAGMFSYPKTYENAIIYTTTQGREFHHPNYRHCQKYKKIHDQMLANVTFDKEQSNHSETLAKKLNIDRRLLPPISSIWEEISALKAHFRNVPKIYETNMDLIEEYAVSYFDYRYLPNQECISYACGLLLNKILENIKLTSQPSSPILFLNSAHDTTILCLLKAFNHRVTNWPIFSSYVSIEILVDDQNAQYIKIIYNGECFQFDDCTCYIPLDDFYKKIKPVAVVEKSFEELCHSH